MTAGIVVTILNVDIEKYTLPLQAVGLCVGVYFSIRIMKWLLGQSFNGYRIALVKTDVTTDSDA